MDLLALGIENTPGIIAFCLDKSYRYTAYTTTHKATMKAIWDVDIAIGDSMLTFLLDNDKTKAKDNFDKTLSGENFVILEEYGDKKFKRSFWENRYSPLVNENKEIIGLTVFVLDVSEHIEISKQLEKTQERLNIALDSGKIGVWEWDVDSDKIYWSEHMYSNFDIDVNTPLKFDTYLQLLHPDDKENVLLIIQTSFSNKQDYVVEHRIITKDKSIRWILGRAKIIIDEHKNVKKVIGTCLNITTQKNIELELIFKNEELTKSNTELDKFVYSVSHDLRSPVASMMGLVNLIKKEKNPESLAHLFDLQEKSLKRMDDFIRDIVDYSKNARLELNYKIVDFKSIINEAFEQLDFMNTDIKFLKNIAISEQIVFVSDPKRIQIVINNIISNCIKYYDAGKPISVIDVAIKTSENEVLISVSDNGIGIKQRDLDKIFNMFYRATAVSKGSGLGLYIVKEVVDKLEGAIEYKSEYGQGTEVKIVLKNQLNNVSNKQI